MGILPCQLQEVFETEVIPMLYIILYLIDPFRSYKVKMSYVV